MFTKKERNNSSDLPTASLADIAFLLLIFFLVTTTIDVDTGIGLTLPAKNRKEDVRPKNILKLLINSAGDIQLNGKEVELGQLSADVRKRLEPNPNLIISVKTDRTTRYQRYIEVMDALRIAEAKRISLADPEG